MDCEFNLLGAAGHFVVGVAGGWLSSGPPIISDPSALPPWFLCHLPFCGQFPKTNGLP